MTFVNEYALPDNATFHALAGADANGFVVAGTFGTNGGLLTLIDKSGNAQWQKAYFSDGPVIRFWTGLRCSNGDYLLHGSLPTSQDLNATLIVRVDALGNVIWAKSYTLDRTRLNVRLIQGPGDTYYFAAWYNETGTRDDIEVTHIDGTGSVIGSVLIHSDADDQVNSIVPFDDGFLIAGTTSISGSWDCFLMAFDSQLQLIWKKLLTGGDFEEVTHAIVISSHEIVLAGDSGDDRRGFIARFSPVGAQVTIRQYDFAPGQSYTLRGLIRIGDFFYLIAAVEAGAVPSFVACFDFQLNLLWQRALGVNGTVALLDIHDAGDNAHGLAVSGVVTGAGPTVLPILAYTDPQFSSCVTRNLTPPPPRESVLTVADLAFTVTRVKMIATDRKITVRGVKPVPNVRCPEGVAIDIERARVQSPYIYLQAAGSDFSDQTVRSIQLRWDFLRRLGETHLAKGNLAAPGGPWPATIGFNRADDFVHIYKAQFRNDYGIDVKFSQPPSSLFESGSAREWLYEDIVSPSGLTTDVSIRFADVSQYDTLRGTIDPHSGAQNFISSYTGVLEVRAVGKLCFLASIQLAPGNPNLGQHLNVEALTLPDPLDNTSRTLACRRIFTAGTNAPIICENIESIRFSYAGVIPTAVHLAPYNDFLFAANSKREWFKVGDFSLDDGNTDADAAVFKRLENPPDVVIDGVWPMFRRVPDPGVFRLNAQNYRDRWRMTDGLKQAVTTYLDASRTDLQARVVVHNSDPIPNDSAMELSYLDLLNFVSLDYHVARMLGLGTIDPMAASPPATAPDRFVYLMLYVTQAQLEHEAASPVTHCYMTPPVSIADYKYPPVPAISLNYGLPPEECNGATLPLTDAGGYAMFDDIRFVNIDRAPFRYEQPMESFFQTPAGISLCDETVPVAFGVSYGAGVVGSGNDERPEISNNRDWFDTAGVAETAPIPERGANPVYTHQERFPGIHHYALYSINWFSRSGVLSPGVQTDATQFPRRSTLLPPSNFAVQLIQKEDPRIFTSFDEQTRLSNLPAGDNTLVRVTYDWNDVQNRAYFFADKVELYFRAKPVGVVRGEIAAVTDDPATRTASVTTKPYVITSVSPAETAQPDIPAADAARFVGARLSAAGQAWLVDSITTNGINPTIVLKQIRSTQSIDANNNNNFCTVESWISPNAGDRFLMAENLDDPNAWETKLAKEVPIVQFQPPFMEFIVNNDGTSRSVIIGGLADSATITEIADPDPQILSFVPSNGPSSVPSGAYTVTFANRQLQPTGDPDVEFHEGMIRIPGVNNEVRSLRVWNIDTSGTTLTLTVWDSEFGLQRDPSTGMFLLDGSNHFKPVDGYVPIQTGSVGPVDFHPSYRVYLTADLASGHNFGEAAILPAPGDRTRETLMTARSRAANVTPPLTSSMARPALLLGLEQREPVAPAEPLGPLFATRPNFFGKATYTVDVEVGDPQSLIFYKANDRKILDQLYQPDTVRDIVAALDAMPDFERSFESQRWHDLVHVVTGPDDNFIAYAGDGSFRFPIPDNASYAIPDPSLPSPVFPFQNNTTPPGQMKAIMQQAIEGAFVPLTEAPLVYRQIHDTSMQTSGRAPLLRNANGDLLAPNDRDPWPMAVRFEKNAAGDVLQSVDPGYGAPSNSHWVRFTDYTIDGASKNIYLYFAVELTNSLKVSARSPIAGPVRLVNSAPPEAPAIRKVTVRLDEGEGEKSRVDLVLGGYLPSEGVVQYKLYRTIDAAAASSVRTMTEVGTFAVGTDVFDEFADLAEVPFAQPIYYRAVAFREIVNERDELELIPSKASTVASTQVADAIHPTPPHITMSSNPLTPMHPFQYTNVSLSWPRTTYKGVYHLYKLNGVGIWEKIKSVHGNDDAVIHVDLNTTILGTDVLLKEDDAGNTLYHRFRVMAENTSGLVNLTQDEVTV